MDTLVIWDGDDHQVRAEKLATTYATTAEKISDKPKNIPGSKTLVF